MNRIVEKNLKKMLEPGDGNLYPFLMFESIGGNAGTNNGNACAAANFHYNKKTGEILLFGNIQDIPEHIRKDYSEGTFKIEIDRKTYSDRIISYKAPTSESAKKNIEDSIAAFNNSIDYRRERSRMQIEEMKKANGVRK